MKNGSSKSVWLEWLEMSLESKSAALLCHQGNLPRSAINRAYYAAYQAATAAIHCQKRSTPPTIDDIPRQAWKHQQTPDILFTDLSNNQQLRHRRRDLSQTLSYLWKLRVQADYVGSSTSFENQATLRKAVRDSGMFVNTIKVALEK